MAAARVTRHAAIAGTRQGRSRGSAEECIWLDTADAALAKQGLALEQPRRGARRLLRTLPPAGAWLPGTPPEAAGDAADAESGDSLVPIAAFSGRRTALTLGAGTEALRVEVLHGKLRAVADERPAARLRLIGPVEAVVTLSRALAADIALLPPRAALAEEGRALARGEVPRPRRRGPPDLAGAATVDAGLAAAIGHLLEVMLHDAPLCRMGAGPEGVHQMRVASRRLRSVLKSFRPAARCAELEAFDAALKALADLLAPARDLDVFLGGLGAAIAEALPEDRRIAALIRAAEARRGAAYRALRAGLDGPGFRALMLDGIALAVRRPWQAAQDAAQRALLAEPVPEFAGRLLDKRWHRLCGEGEDIESHAAEALHEVRLEAKRLRYAAELFAPLWPGKATRRFQRRLAELQEELGIANDVSVARALVASLGPAVPGWAIGAVEGFSLARVGGARKRALSAWKDLMVTDPFWSAI